MEAEKIQDIKRFEIFKALAEDQPFVNVRMKGGGYERLTTVGPIRRQGKFHYFQVDYEENLQKAIQQRSKWELHFEFLGRDKLRYSFVCSTAETSAREIWLRMPDTIWRHQRRNYFRIRPLDPVFTVFDHPAGRFEHEVINISLGGMLFAGKHLENQQRPELNPQDKIKNIFIRAPLENEEIQLHIRRGKILRIEKTSTQTLRFYGVKFTDIDVNQEKILNDLIYQLQRINLRKRIPTKSSR